MKDECRDITAFLDAYLDGALGVDERGVFDAHIAECPDCVHFLASYRTARALAAEALGAAPRRAPDARAPAVDAAPERLIAAILAARPRGPKRPGDDA